MLIYNHIHRSIYFFVPLTPQRQQGWWYFLTANQNMVYPRLFASYANHWRPQTPWAGSIEVDVTFTFQLLDGDAGHVPPDVHLRRPNIGDLINPVMEGLRLAGYYENEKQVIRVIAFKTYGPHDGTEVIVRFL